MSRIAGAKPTDRAAAQFGAAAQCRRVVRTGQGACRQLVGAEAEYRSSTAKYERYCPSHLPLRRHIRRQHGVHPALIPLALRPERRQHVRVDPQGQLRLAGVVTAARCGRARPSIQDSGSRSPRPAAPPVPRPSTPCDRVLMAPSPSARRAAPEISRVTVPIGMHDCRMTCPTEAIPTSALRHTRRDRRARKPRTRQRSSRLRLNLLRSVNANELQHNVTFMTGRVRATVRETRPQSSTSFAMTSTTTAPTSAANRIAARP